MLHDLLEFFGGVSPGGALALLAIGFLVGAASKDYLTWVIGFGRGWYAGRHD